MTDDTKWKLKVTGYVLFLLLVAAMLVFGCVNLVDNSRECDRLGGELVQTRGRGDGYICVRDDVILEDDA